MLTPLHSPPYAHYPCRIFIALLSVCLCLWLAEGAHAAGRGGDEPAHCGTANNLCTNNSIHREGKLTHLCVKVKVVTGKLKVDRDNTCFNIRPSFAERLKASKLTAEAVREILLNRIDAAFDTKERLLNYVLTPGTERETVGKQSCADVINPEAKKLCDFSGTWKDFTALAEKWKPGTSLVLPSAILALAGESALSEVGEDSPLELRQPTDSVAIDGAAGLFLISVADPIGRGIADPVGSGADATEYQVCIGGKCDGGKSDPPRTVSAPNDIRKALKPLVGRLWDKSEIVGLIQEYYAGKGLLATVEVGSAFEEQKQISIKESPRLLSISVTQDLKPVEIDKAMYLLLPDRQFRRYAKCREDFIVASPDPLRPTVVDIKSLMSTGTCDELEESEDDLPYLNLLKLQLQKLQLNTIDLDVGVGETMEDGEEYVFLQVLKAKNAEAKGEKKKGENDKAAPLSNEQGRVDPNLARPEAQNSFAPRVTVEPSPTPTPAPISTPSLSASPTPDDDEDDAEKKKEKRNYLGGGFEYRSGEGVRVFGLYQRSKLLSDNDGISLKFGGHDEPLGAVNYYADYLFFERLQRRLTVQLTGSSDLRANRVFNGQKTDERRTGALARAELELFRDRGGNLLRLSLDAQRMTVELKRDETTVGKQNLSTLDLGALYLLQPDYELDYPRWARLEPRMRFGLGLARGEPTFQAFSTSGNFHQKLPGFFEVDISGRLGLATARTPLFELPTLGGAESVRGFRQDEAVGRKMWSLQNELWAPLPGTTNSVAEFRRFLLRSVRLAAFADVGGVSQAAGSQPGLRFGPGAGLRFIFNPIVIKADWAYGLTAPASTTGRGRFYFSIASNLPF